MYLWSRSGRLAYIYKIKIIATPVTKTINAQFVHNSNANIYLPENVSSYTLSATNLNIFQSQRISVSGNKLNFYVRYSGKSTLYFYDKSPHKWLRYIVNIDVQPRTRDVTIYINQTVKIGWNYAYNYQGLNYGLV
jgi:hypothetical protein